MLTEDVEVVVLPVEGVAGREGVLRLEDRLRPDRCVVVADSRQRPRHLKLVLVAVPPDFSVD